MRKGKEKDVEDALNHINPFSSEPNELANRAIVEET